MPVHADGRICSDPNCRCHRLRGSEDFFSAYVFSRERELSFPAPAAAQRIAAALVAPLDALAESCSENGIIPGHIKGTVKCGGILLFSFSVTRCGTVDFTWAGGDARRTESDRFTLRLNVLSTKTTEATEAAAEQALCPVLPPEE